MPPLPARLKLAAEHIDGARFDQARTVLQRFLASEPGHGTANGMMGFVLARLGEPGRALYHLDRAVAAEPANPDLLANLGNTRLSTGDAPGAAAAYRQALALQAGHLFGAVGLINALNAQSLFGQADAIGEQAIAANPDHFELILNRAATLLNLGHSDKAISLLRRAVSLRPKDPLAAGSLAFAMNYAPGLSNGEVTAAHERYGSLIEQLTPDSPPPRPASDPERPLRIGLISADFRAHAVGHFIEPWLRCRDSAQFKAICYSTALRADAMSKHLRGLASQWRSVPYLSAAALAATIRNDRIDILIDLSGLTAGHRLPVLAMQPAPVQVTYLGYPNTTGLRACTHRIVDSLTDPPESDRAAVEHLVRLDPCFVCYQIPADSPPQSAPACEAGGGITFGSFNSLQKYNDTLLGIWARLLVAVPGSRLILKAREFAEDSVRARTANRLVQAGIDPARLELLPPSATLRDHLGSYSRIDIALDTFPYGGTTTTCEALAMGVPVVTLAETSHAGRVGISLLSAVGLQDLLAPDSESYIRTAAALASNRTKLAELRRSLRSTLTTSPLGTAPAFAARFDAALRTMWQQACSRA